MAKLEVVDISRKVVIFAERGESCHFTCPPSTHSVQNFPASRNTLQDAFLSLAAEPPPISSKSFLYKLYNANHKPVIEVRFVFVFWAKQNLSSLHLHYVCVHD